MVSRLIWQIFPRKSMNKLKELTSSLTAISLKLKRPLITSKSLKRTSKLNKKRLGLSMKNLMKTNPKSKPVSNKFLMPRKE